LVTRVRRILRGPEPASAGWALPAVAAAIAVAVAFVFQAGAQDVKKIPVHAGEPLQVAIDAAPAGAVLKLDAGEGKERIVITKPITIEGDGWEKTLIRPDNHDPEAAAAGGKLRIAESQKRGSVKDWDAGYEPTVIIRSTSGVILRGVKIQG